VNLNNFNGLSLSRVTIYPWGIYLLRVSKFMTAKVEIYGTSFCRHCVDAKDFLQEKGFEYEEYLLDLMPHEKDVMIKRCGEKSIPQIFINGQHVGGMVELMELDSSGKLGKLLCI
jgi:glutaredoxin 3